MSGEPLGQLESHLDAESKRKAFRRRLFLWSAVLLPLVWLMLLRLLALGNGENSLDVFYHVRISEQGPAVFSAKEFPALQMSIWRDSFSDKEWLFHFLLWMEVSVRKLFGFDLHPPFHFEYFFFCILTVVSFVFAARKMGVRARIIAAGVLLGFGICANYLVRVTMLRPHVLSIALLCFMMGILAQEKWKDRAWGVFVLSLLYGYAYSNPHFVILLPLLFALLNGWKANKREWLLPLLALLGVFLAMVVHPQFPNTFQIWKVQSLDALSSPLSVLADVNRVPTELSSLSGRDFVSTVPLFILVFLNLILCVRLWEYSGRKAVSVPTLVSGIFGLLFTIAFFWAKRSLEYAVPFSVLAFLSLLDLYLHSEFPGYDWKKHWKKTAAILFAVSVLLMIISCVQYWQRLHNRTFHPRTQLAEFVQTHFPPGTVFFNADWSDFPMLYYDLSEYRFLWGMDPSFSYVVNPRKVKMLTSSVPAQQLRSEIAADYVILLHPRRARMTHLKNCGWHLVAYIPNEGWIFSANPEP